ncbi:endoglucanase [Stackebrandtia albiflava]|uniref:cellulase n=1 Tax=Stackebrandtia albiflava TaxID=406432 RepID=A0A562V9T6_9ACTN|nr:glycoside hydrolase family 5 protein [Stackebrandtia albiflava]TWJ14644.1 endoglucanase [Stackebrandtia albiflava]
MRPSRRSRIRFAAATAVAAALLVPSGAAHGTAAPDSSADPATTETAVQAYGQVSVCGTTLCDESGQPVQLRGMSTHGLQWYGDCVTDESLDALAYDWNADVLRVSMYVQEGGYETDPAGYTALVNSVVEKATDRGLYVIIDWHMLSPGDPHYNLSRAKTFFTAVAREHADKENVLYEVANEPNGVDWPRIKSYHEQIIPVIRQHDPDSVILLGTRAWSSLGVSDGADETEVIDDPVDADNVMYTFHFYAASHREYYLDTLDRASDVLPIFVTEFGTQDYSGDGANDFAMAGRYLDLMNRKNISWTNWNFSDDFRSGAVFQTGTCPNGPFDYGSLKPAGQWIHQRLGD